MFTELMASGSGGSGVAPFDFVPDVSSYFQSYIMPNLFDDDTTTRWVASGANGTLTIYNLKQHNVAALTIRGGGYEEPNAKISVTVYGSNTSKSDRTTQLFSRQLCFNDGETIVATNTSYKYYIIDAVGNASYYASLVSVNLTV